MKYYDFDNPFARLKALLVFALLIIASILWMYIDIPHIEYGGLLDIGHTLVPSLRNTIGEAAAAWLWFIISFSFVILMSLIIARVLLLGKGKKLLLSFGIIAFLHGLFWHLTFFPIPADIVWQFPLPTGEVPTPYDFWPSGHVAYGFLFAFYATTQLTRKWAVCAWLFVIALIYMVLATRTHYSIDVIGSLFVTYSIWNLCKKAEF